MKRLAFVSSFDESCGNAYFTNVLIDSVNRLPGWQAEAVGLDLFLTQSVSRHLSRHAETHITALAARLKSYDAVNIQFEPSLFGTLPSVLTRRFEQLLTANPYTSVTLHSPRLTPPDTASQRRILKNLLQLNFRAALSDFKASAMGNVQIKVNQSAMDIIVRHKAPVIVHTQRAQRVIERLYDYHDVAVHPLKFVAPDFLPEAGLMARVRRMLAVQPDDVLIGMFGYITAYKGHTDALRALALLPPNHKLLIFGRQHPQSITANRSDAYQQSLLALCRELGVQERVQFMGELPERDFASAAAGVDVCWLPYYENGQDGSGIASICLDLCPRVLCSASLAFDELFRLIPYGNMLRFDIGNYLELAHKTTWLLREPKPAQTALEQRYTLQTQAECYVRPFAGAASGG